VIAVNDRNAIGSRSVWATLRGSRVEGVVRLMAGYAIVQGGLYAALIAAYLT
jgi:hypothetical protein